MKKLARRLCLYVLVWSGVIAGLLVFGTARPPPVDTALTQPFASIDEHGLPPLRTYRARDGAQLSFREYPAGEQRAAVLIHGSSGSSLDMHPLALALQAAGVTVYVPDIRGHGADRPHGDIAYVGQLEDDYGYPARGHPRRRRGVFAPAPVSLNRLQRASMPRPCGSCRLRATARRARGPAARAR